VLVRGSPAKVVRDLNEEEWTLGRRLADRYVGVARDHAREDDVAKSPEGDAG
jgi:carbonic anhydrase/acetyltransferase-like protein (isoleucine patch superfamily)